MPRASPASKASALPSAAQCEREVLAFLEAGRSALLATIDQRHGAALTAEAQAAARQRSKDLSTTADVAGIAFKGPALHRLYYDTKFVRRGLLLYQTLAAVFRNRELQLVKDTLLQQPMPLTVSSIGGGPGTDAAGLVHFSRHFLAATAASAASAASQTPSSRPPSPPVLRVSTPPLTAWLLDYEGSWKRHVSTLSGLFAPDVELAFAQTDVTQSLEAGINAHLARQALRASRLFIFSYVCHETSSAAMANKLAFYRDLARLAPMHSVFVFLDVMQHSQDHLNQVLAAMSDSLLQNSPGDEDTVEGRMQTVKVDTALQQQLKSSVALAVKLPKTLPAGR